MAKLTLIEKPIEKAKRGRKPKTTKTNLKENEQMEKLMENEVMGNNEEVMETGADVVIPTGELSQSKVETIVNYFKDKGFGEKAIQNRLEVELEKELKERNQNPIKSMTISIEWRRSRKWGMNPKSTAKVTYLDGTTATVGGFNASGDGYDKEAKVVSDLFNATLKYKLWEQEGKDINKDDIPYGVNLNFNWSPTFDSVGVKYYYDIAKFLGFEFKEVARTKMADIYTLEMV